MEVTEAPTEVSCDCPAGEHRRCSETVPVTLEPLYLVKVVMGSRYMGMMAEASSPEKEAAGLHSGKGG